jgi:nicotinate-nucleotide adenylyltransferase
MTGGGARIGVFGGTFDPPHIGHLSVAVEVRASLALERVLLVVANDPWQKRGERVLTPAADRYEMVRLAVEGLDGIEADDREIRRGGASYTVDTVRELRAEQPGAELYVVVGGDAAAGLMTWERAGELADLATIVVVHRPGFGVPDGPPGFRWQQVEVPALDVSSSDIRARVHAGRPIDVLVPAATATWITRHRIYSRVG